MKHSSYLKLDTNSRLIICICISFNTNYVFIDIYYATDNKHMYIFYTFINDTVHPTVWPRGNPVQSATGEQKWVTGFHCV